MALLLAVGLASRPGSGAADNMALNWNLAIPHVVWAVALLLFLAQSGLLARLAATAGLIQVPADFPVLVRDSYGLGIILHYISKETPFLALIVLAALRGQPAGYGQVAANLGANRWQRLRYVTLPFVTPALLAGACWCSPSCLAPTRSRRCWGWAIRACCRCWRCGSSTIPTCAPERTGMAISLILALIVLGVAGLSLKQGRSQ